MTAHAIILVAGAVIPLLALARWRPASIRRPAWWAALLYALQLGIAAVWIPSEISDPLIFGAIPIPSTIPEQTARLATVLFPACLCAWLALTPALDPRTHETAAAKEAFEPPSSAERLLLAMALGLVACGLLLLLSAVPLTETGLWALVTDPGATTSRRESTFKLLPSGLAKTVYGHATTVGMPLAMAMIVARRWFADRFADLVFRSMIAGLVLIAASLSGARSPAAQLLILAGLVVFVVAPPTPRLGRMVGIGGVALLIVLMLTVVIASAQSTSALPDRTAALSYWVARRAFSVPFQTGLWHLQYVAEHGVWNADGIYLPLRTSLGGEYADPSTVVGRWYATEVLAKPELSTTMNTSDLFTMMSATSIRIGFVLAFGLIVLADIMAATSIRARGAIGIALTTIVTWLAARSANGHFTGPLVSWAEIAVLALVALSIGTAIDRGRHPRSESVSPSGSPTSPGR